MLRFIMRWQQFTGPVMAKGLEDTASYRHNGLISLNEVGGDPLRVSPPMDLAGFHDFNRRRAERGQGGLNATSTHDTKRGEDARARINVLSELPREWEEQFDCWTKQNEARKRHVRGEAVPGANEEYLIYQTLLGTWPGDEDMAGYAERICEFITKASREAKMHTNWIQPDTEWEAAICDFAADILGERRFMDAFLPFQKRVAFYGALNGLAQALIKIASPGVPDFYQGSELWNLSMVDPDNRRPVDYRKRREMLDEIRGREAGDREALAVELAGDPVRPEAKLYVVARALGFRREHAALFAEGEYVAAPASGAHAANVIAFARRKGDEWALAVAPRWLTQLECKPPSAACDWGDTVLELPEGAPATWRDAFTGADVARAAMADVLRRFPVALLEGR
jgi:(1->4)-alpha-D-glucan 1-alpha-D-glucosylmutase